MENEIKQLKATIDNLHQEHFKETTNLIAKHEKEKLEMFIFLTHKHYDQMDRKMKEIRIMMDNKNKTALRDLKEKFIAKLSQSPTKQGFD